MGNTGAAGLGGPDTPPQQLLLVAPPTQPLGAWLPHTMGALLSEPVQPLLSVFSPPLKAKAARKPRGRAGMQKPPKTVKDKGVLLAMARFASRQASAAQVLHAATDNSTSLLASAPPAGAAAEHIGHGGADDGGLQPAALLEAVDWSKPVAEVDAEHYKELANMFLAEHAQ